MTNTNNYLEEAKLISTSDESQACETCRTINVKCDGKFPACTRCVTFKTEGVLVSADMNRNLPE
jgi:hypothetical protein